MTKKAAHKILLNVFVSQAHMNGAVMLDIMGDFRTEGNPDFTVFVTDPQGRVTELPSFPAHLAIEDPELWWPRGYGEQPLYTVRVEAMLDGKVADFWEQKIGLRTASMSIERDRYGESFAHMINGVKVFAMGASYIPRYDTSPELTRRLLEDAAAANFNCIRVRGGAYPDESFYDICDQLGLMVWQDLALTGSAQELATPAAWSVKAQVRSIVTRLRSRPCVVLWCGGDSLELSAPELTPRQRADYIRVFEYIVPVELQRLAPNAFYWPSSPSSGGGFDEPDSPHRGDVHPKCSDPGEPGRYVSDFGTPSCPCLPTVEAFARPQERNLFSRAMEEHSEGPRDTAHIMSNIQRYYLCPSSFDTLIYASQLSQAEILRAAAQRYRRHRGRCMGALYRQLNGPRPGISCSSIDYAGRWKALHYFAKRFFAPLLLSCGEISGTDKALRLCVSNETLCPRTVLIQWALRDNLCHVKREETISLTVPPLDSARLDPVPLPEADIFSDFVTYALYEKGAPISFGTALFVPPKYYEFRAPRLSCRLEGDQIIVASQAYAQGVEIRNSSEDLVLSDNYFDMLPGERRVKILRGKPDNLRVRSVFDIK